MAENRLKNIANITYQYQPDPKRSIHESGEIQSNITNDTFISPEVYFEKTTCNKVVTKGNVVHYTLLAVNKGSAELSNIVISDELPIIPVGTNNYEVMYIENSVEAKVNGSAAGTTVDSTDLNNPKFTVQAAAGAMIMPEDIVLIQFKAKVPQGALDYIASPDKTMPVGADPLVGRIMTNTAKLGFTYKKMDGGSEEVLPGDTAKGGKIATATTEIHEAHIWASKKLETPTIPVIRGSEINYVFTLTNKGDREASNVKLSDLLPSDFKVTNGMGIVTLTSPDNYSLQIVPAGGNPGSVVATLNTATNHFLLTGLIIPPAGSQGSTYYDGSVTITLKGRYKVYTP